MLMSLPVRLPNPRTAHILIAATLPLLLPLIAMRFDIGVDWNWFDFVAAWLMMFSAGMAYKLVSSRSENTVYRLAGVLAAGTGMVLTWGNLAAGAIGNERDPINLLYFGVIAIALFGSLVARFRPRGTSLAMFATAASHIVITAIALALGKQHGPESSVLEIVGFNAFFALLWVGAGMLFRRAASTPPE